MTKAHPQSAGIANTADEAVDSFAPHAAKTWLTVFPVTALGIFLAQPGPQFSIIMAIGLTAALAYVAHFSATTVESRRFNIGQMMMGLVAPVQFALMIWASVYAARLLAGESLALSSLTALGIFACMLMIDALVSAVLLLIAGHKQSVTGISLAAFVAGKYSGLLGRVI